MAEGTERPKRCCAKCGAEVRLDSDYCASCRGLRGAPYSQRTITVQKIAEAAKRKPLVALVTVFGSLVLVWVLTGWEDVLSLGILALGIAAIAWVAVGKDRRIKDLGDGSGPRHERPRAAGPTGWELGEIERELERLHVRKRRERVWYVLAGLAFLVFFGVMTSMVGEYAIVFVLPLLVLVGFGVLISGDSTGDRIAYLERRKAYLERGASC